MNKFLLTIPIISLLIFGSMMSYHGLDLKSSVGITEDFTFFDWAKCYSNLPMVTAPCIVSDGYTIAANQFANLTNIESKFVSQACKNYTNYFLNAEAHFKLNNQNYFFDCFLSELPRKIASQNKCFFDNYYAPLYLNCTNTPASSKKQVTLQASEVKTSTVTFEQWARCYSALPSDREPCQTTDEYYKAAGQFDNLTRYESGSLTNECKAFYKFFLNARADEQININGLFEKCYLTEDIKKIADSNSCFNDKYYAPRYVKCAGF